MRLFGNVYPDSQAAHSEGHILLLGLGMAVGYAGWLVLSLFASPQTFHVWVGITATHILFGRAAGMSFGYALGYGHFLVISVNLLVETIMVLLLYPLFVFAWLHIVEWPVLKERLDRIRASAESHRKTIRRYGILGLFGFVCIPFWMTGPVVGSALGFLMGLPGWRNVTIVLSATTLASIGWAVFLHELHARVADYSPFAPMILLLFIIAIALAGYFLERKHQQREASLEKHREKDPEQSG